MGIFSLFGKKEGEPQTPVKKRAAASPKREARQPAAAPATVAPTRAQPIKRDPQAARATVLKIDAIESEMSSEFVPSTTLRTTTLLTNPPPTIAAPATVAGEPQSQAGTSSNAAPAQADNGDMGQTTEMLFASTFSAPDAIDADAAPVIEEAAILYAGGQTEVVEQMLRAAIAPDAGSESSPELWHMLFDLYQCTGKQPEFEQLSIDYVRRFEMSPPGWKTSGTGGQEAESSQGAKPIVPFSGNLDASAAKYIDRIHKLAENYRSLRLEFLRVSAVEASGCALLLAALNKLQKSEHDLVLVGAAELIEKIRGMIEVGRRDDTEPCWLLMLELMRLLNQEKEFEEASIDYCVTFEVSPPAFSAPQAKVTTATGEAQPPEQGLLLPPVIEGRIDELIVKIANYSDTHDPAILDCSQLVRVDFNAAGRLLTGLAPFCSNGKVIEFQHVNHLVLALFHVIGLQNLVRVVPAKA